MSPGETHANGSSADADVCLVLEGTYPYVRGGVSAWVHELIGDLPDLRFSLVHVGPECGTYPRRHYALPGNVIGLFDLYCREPLVDGRDPAAFQRAAHAERRRHASTRRSSRVLRGIRRLHLGDEVDESLLNDLASRDLSVGAFLHGRESFDLTVELCERVAPAVSLLDFFWHFRSMHLPLVRLLGAVAPIAANYHALCTGYAGTLAAVWSHRSGRPFILTEHGIYTRERSFELERAAWLHETRDRGTPTAREGATTSALRQMWVRFFQALSRVSYARASGIVSLCEGSRQRQIADGAAADRTVVIPNGIDLDSLPVGSQSTTMRRAGSGPMRVGFVGRIVPIKDVVTLIRATAIASRVADLEVRVFGPIEEDPAYVRRCRRLVTALGLEHTIRFEGARPRERIYPELDIVVLTSFSEGQPLVILEAGAAGVPVVASDVGACRELLEGRSELDRQMGPSGIVTRLAAPQETAAAIVRLAADPELRRRMGAAGERRVAAFYRKDLTLSAYRLLYRADPWLASAGASSA